MASVGERLRYERASRGMTIDQMADATGIGASYLDALERDDFNGLPGRAFGKLYIRAYAEALRFDPQPLVDDYDRASRLVPGEPRSAARWRPDAPSTAEAPQPPTISTPASEPSAPSAVPRAAVGSRRLAIAAAIGIVVVATALGFGLRGTGQDETGRAPTTAPPKAAPPPAPDPGPRYAAAPVAPAPQPPPAPRKQAEPGRPSVSESGLGRRVVHSRLEGEGDRFAPGEVAWFQTRVVGGRSGESIRHVWIFDGRAQQSIVLRLGGSDWRTQSSKTLYKTGPWSVEARDASGRVLASAAFTCAPASPTDAP